jgi:excisionase family DNA binding protein
MDRLITVAEAARIKGVTKQTIYRWVNVGKLSMIPSGSSNTLLIDSAELRDVRKPNYLSKAPCPDYIKHIEGPEGYVEWHLWAEEMSKTHNQRKCKGCGLYTIWVPKKEKFDVPVGDIEAYEPDEYGRMRP